MPTVLLIDDEVIIRMSLRETLQDVGLEVVEASNGEEASRVINSLAKIDLVMTDLTMPGKIQGSEIIELTKYKRPEAHIVAFSGNPDLIDRVATAHVLHKPFDCSHAGELALRLLNISN